MIKKLEQWEAIPFLKLVDAIELLEAFLIMSITASKLSSPTMMPLFYKTATQPKKKEQNKQQQLYAIK